MLNSKLTLFLALSVVAISIVLDLNLRYVGRDVANVRNSLHVMSAMFSLMAILISVRHLREPSSDRRARIAVQLLHAEQQRYEQDKRLHDAINIKCHDIRHQIAALDVVLTGKSLSCTSQNITLTYMADGRRIGFMKDSDIYALFGNIPDNAIDAVNQIEDPERRLISLREHARQSPAHRDREFLPRQGAAP